MIRWFGDLIYGAKPASFESHYSIRESVSRLQQVVKPTVLQSLAVESAVGMVSEERVSLQRVIPLVGNSYKPTFIGSFKTVRDRVVLTGEFTLSRAMRLFLSVWFALLAIFVVAATAVVLPTLATDFWFPLFGVVLFGLGVALAWAGKSFARNDIAWLSRVISDALGSRGAQPPVAADAPQAARR